MSNKTIEVGDKVKDSVSGFTGIVIAEHTYLHGCTRFSVQPLVSKDGKMPDAISFDEPQLVLVSKKKVARGDNDTGGPKPEVSLNRPEGRR